MSSKENFEKIFMEKYPLSKIDEKRLERARKVKREDCIPLRKIFVENSSLRGEIVDFYKSVDPKLGEDIENICNFHSGDIMFHYKYDPELTSEGYTWMTKSKEDKTPRITISMSFVPNFTVYTTGAHEEMHALELKMREKNEETSEIDSSFMELLMMDYLKNKGIISEEERQSHFQAMKNEISDRSEKIDDAKWVYEKISSGERVSDKLIEEFSMSRCNGDSNETKRRIDNLLEMFDPRNEGKANFYQNNVRMLNGRIAAIDLYKAYEKNPEQFMKKYIKMMYDGQNHSYDSYISSLTTIEDKELEEK